MQILHDGLAVIVGIERVEPKMLPDNIKVIGCNATGTDHLPWDFIEKKGIRVYSLKDEREFLRGITSTAEHTVGLIISLLRNYKRAFNSEDKRDTLTGGTISGKTLGIIGWGRVGVQVDEIAQALGMNVLIYDNDPNVLSPRNDLGRLLDESDIVSLHIPLDGNEGFFTKEMFERMKPTAYLINTSRPGVVDEKALREALKNGTIAGAAVDFMEDKRLLNMAKSLTREYNLILTNHIGGNTYEDRQRTYDFIRAKVDAWVKNHRTSGDYVGELEFITT